MIGFPRGAGAGYAGFAAAAGVQAVALDTGVDPALGRAATLQPRLCVQGNLDPLLLVIGGRHLREAARARRSRPSPAGPHLQPRARHHPGRRPGQRRGAAAGDPRLTQWLSERGEEVQHRDAGEDQPDPDERRLVEALSEADPADGDDQHHADADRIA